MLTLKDSKSYDGTQPGLLPAVVGCLGALLSQPDTGMSKDTAEKVAIAAGK